MTRLHFLPHSTVQSILRWPTRSHVLAKFPRQMDHRSRVAALGQAVVACSRVALMILIVGLLGIPSLTVAQSSVTMNPTSGLAGTRVDATGSGFTPSSVDLDAEVFVFWDLNFEGSFLAEATINSLGNFAVSFNVPQDATVGEHQITFLDEETPTNDQTLTFTVTAPPTPPPKLLGISEGAGRIWITGHDPDLHCFDTSAGDQCNYFGQAVNFVVNDSTLPVLALDHGTQIAAATSNALGASAPEVVTVDPRTGFASLPLVSAQEEPLYSAIIVASDVTCGAIDSGPACSNNELTSTPDSDAINARAADITEFFTAGGGILALAGAAHRDVYYDFLPVEVTPLSVTPPPGAPGNPGAFMFASSEAPATWEQALGLTNSDINCCITHNSFVPAVRGPLTIVEIDAAISPEPGLPSGNAVTLIGVPGVSSREEQEDLVEKGREEEGLSLLIGTLLGLAPRLCPGCTEAVRAGLDVLFGSIAVIADRILDLLDPIDLNFMVIAQPVVPDVPQVTAGPGFTEREAAAVNALANNLAHQIALSDALRTSINRVQGARLTENREWEAKQLQAVRRYAAQLAKLLEIELGLLANAAKAFRAAEFSTQPITAADVREAQNDIAIHGFTAEAIAVLEQLGATRTDINQIQQDFVALDPDAVAALGGGQFPQALVDPSVINATRRAADVLRQLARCDDGDTDKRNDEVSDHRRASIKSTVSPSSVKTDSAAILCDR